jgi:hypothetical protein
MQKFRRLIAPELEINKVERDYFDNWDGRMYLYSSELNYEPTRNKSTVPIKFNIDMNIFKTDFKGGYILACAEISNKDELRLDFVSKYCDKKSIYTIYSYRFY